MSDEKTMTNKEVAEVFNVRPNLIQETGLRLFPDKERRNGVAIRWTEDEVTEISKEIKRNMGKGNSNVPLVQTKGMPSTHKEVMQRAGEVLKDLMSILAEMSDTSELKDERIRELEHQVEYNATIGTMRWRDVKKALGLSVTKEQMLADTHLEEDVDYFLKCMGYDKYPTLLLTDNALSIIKQTYSSKEE